MRETGRGPRKAGLASALLAALALAGGGACGGQATPDGGAQAEASRDGAPDSTAAVGEIRALGEQHARAVAERDTARIGDIYGEDVVYLLADGPREHGREAVRGAWSRGVSVPGLAIRYTPETIEVARSGDLAYERGVVAVSRDGKPMSDGNYVYVWKKRNGEWRVALYMWNTREPAS